MLAPDQGSRNVEALNLRTGASRIRQPFALKRRRRSSLAAKVLGADINLDAALETKRIIEAEGGICEAVAGDVSRADDVAAVVDACIQAFGRIDVLHNNVGIVEVGGPVETSEESWDSVNDVNLKSII